MQTDPIGYEDQMNLYAYVRNDPVNAVDPSGMATSLVVNAVRIGTRAYKYKNIGGAVRRIGKDISYDWNQLGSESTATAGEKLGSAADLILGTAFNESSDSTESKGQGQAEVGDCPTCGGDTSNKPGKIGKEHGLKPKEVRDRIHGAKNGTLTGNPDVEVCNDCGEMFPQTENGTLGDSIGNIEDKY